ncbi:MAG: redoxin domain-containing protein [Atopobiaceae bacterium]|nr:redoxin domain-containing protein [Atopobiaceae bacterium]
MGAISAPLVLVEGLLSFLSPCVLPVIPLYLGYLAGDVAGAEGGKASRARTVANAMAFCLGVAAALFVLGLGASALGQAFSQSRGAISAVGGVVVIALGAYQLVAYGRGGALDRERRLPLALDRLAMSPLVALAMGFAFSFAWTPCVGPALASVLVLAASSATAGSGFALIGLYALGFCLPFLAMALVADRAVALLRGHARALSHVVQAGGVLLLVVGVLLVSGATGGISKALAGPSGSAASPSQAATAARPAAPDFTLVDQNGVSQSLSAYRGKVVLLNFWATWCTYCKREMPDIQAMYEGYGSNAGDVVVLGVANPSSSQYPNNADGSQEEVAAFLSENGCAYPVAMDATKEVFKAYSVTSYPKTVAVGPDGTIAGVISGAASRSAFEGLVGIARSCS